MSHVCCFYHLLAGAERVPGHGIRGMRSLLQFADWNERAFVTFVFDVTAHPDDPPQVTSLLFELDLSPVAVPSPYAEAAQASFRDTFEHVEVRTTVLFFFNLLKTIWFCYYTLFPMDPSPSILKTIVLNRGLL